MKYSNGQSSKVQTRKIGSFVQFSCLLPNLWSRKCQKWLFFFCAKYLSTSDRPHQALLENAMVHWGLSYISYIASPLSVWEQLLLDLDNVLDANDVLCSEPPGTTCDSTASKPIRDALHAKTKGVLKNELKNQFQLKSTLYSEKLPFDFYPISI